MQKEGIMAIANFNEGPEDKWETGRGSCNQTGAHEEEEKAGTQETYWAWDSIWIYSMS